MLIAKSRFLEMCFVLTASTVCATPVLAVITWLLLPLEW
jgi:hypothetical protein